MMTEKIYRFFKNKEAIRKAKAFFFPERCPYCNAVIEADEIACKTCKAEIVDGITPLTRGVAGCRCVSPYRYDKKIRKAILNFKMHDRPDLARALSAVMAACVKEQFSDIRFDFVTFVPMTKKDETDRGFNQSKLLAGEIAKVLDIPCAAALKKTKQTKKQHHLKKSEREKNLKGAFTVNGKIAVTGKNILLADDIVTTGTTLKECIKALTKEKPNIICIVTAANAGMDEKIVNMM